MGDTATLIRLIAASTLVGLLAYCLAHVVQVWRKRNARAGGERAPVGRRLAWACLVAGIILFPASAVHRELTRSEGLLTGEGLFVVRAGEDLPVAWLRDGDAVVAGEPLARYGSGPRSARAEELQARLSRAEAEFDVLALLPLTPDPELTRRHQSLSLERTQAQQELGQALIAAEAAGRDLTAQVFAKKEALAKLELTLTEHRKELDRTSLRSNHARLQLTAYDKLSGSRSISASEYQDQLKASRDAEIEVAALSQEVKDLLAEKDEFRSQLDKIEARRSDPAGPLRTQVAALTARLAALQTQEAELKSKIDGDLARSAKLREAEKAQASAKIREQRAGVDSVIREQEVLAPFAGRLAYRTASPNAVRPRGTLAVLAPEEGFLLTARMGQADADALREGAEAMIELGEDSPERRIPARFRKASALAHEPGYAALQLECQPPPEMVRRLAEGEKLTVAFAWHQPLTAMWPFRAGLLLFVAGLAGLILTGWYFGRPSQPDRRIPSALVNIDLMRPMEMQNSEEVEDTPFTYDRREPVFRDPFDHEPRATRPAVAVAILTRISRLRRARKSLKAGPRPDRFLQLREVLSAGTAPAPADHSLKQLTSGAS